MNDDQSEVIKHLETVNAVAAEYLKGKNETEISRELDIPRVRVVQYLSEWRTTAANSQAVRARAREALAGADVHYTKLIKEAYRIIDDANAANAIGDLNQNQTLGHRATALKMVADWEAKRIDMLQKAGLLENQELADKLLEQERQQEEIMRIIKEVVGSCPVCKPKVLARISGLNGNPVTIVEGHVS